MTSLLQWNLCVGMKNYVEIKHCVEINTQTNWLIDTNLSADCKILRTVEFDLKLLDCLKKPTIWAWVVKMTSNCKIPNASWLKIQVDSIFIEQYCLENWMKSLRKGGFIYTYFFLKKY